MNKYIVTCKEKGQLTIYAGTEFQACKRAQSVWNMNETTRYGTPIGIRADYAGPVELHDANVNEYERINNG